MTSPADSTASADRTKRRPGFLGRWVRRLVKLVVLLLVLLAALPFALRLGPVRGFVADQVGARVGRTVRIGEVSGWWAGGFTVRDLVVESPAGFDRPLLTVPAAHASLRWGALLGGDVEIDASVDGPHIVLLERADGARNVDDLFPGRDREPRPREDAPGRLTLRLAIHDGVVEAPRAPGEAATRVEDIDVRLDLVHGHLTADVGARLAGMRAGGGDASLTAHATRDPRTGGPLRLKTSDRIDLARLEPVLERFGAVEGLRGTLSVDVDATQDGSGQLGGRLGADGEGLLVRLAGGTTLALRSLVITGEQGTSAGRLGTLDVTLTDLDATRTRIDAAPLTLREPLVTMKARWSGGTADEPIRVTEASVEAGATARIVLAEPFVIPKADGLAQGLARADIDLARLAPVLGAFPQLARIAGGRVEAQVRMRKDGAGPLQAVSGLRVRDLALAPTADGLPGAREPQIDAQLRWSREADGDHLELLQVSCSALQTSDRLRTQPLRLHLAGEEDTRVDGPLEAQVDLARAQPWLAALGMIDPPTRLSGRVELVAEVSTVGAERRVRGRTTATDVDWQKDAADPGWQGLEAVILHDLAVAAPGGMNTATSLQVQTNGLTLDADGARWRSEPEPEVDATVRLRGDAGHLDKLLRKLMGAGYEDLRGAGALGGSVTVRGAPGDGAGLLLVDGRLTLGSWRSQGLDVGNLTLGLSRASATAPLTADLEASVNTGTAKARLGIRLDRPARPWSVHVEVVGVDTSPLMTQRGAGRYLAYAIPALLPADANVPVLSGRLDAQVDLEAAALDAPLRDDSLRGRARVHLTEGEIRQSTLFQGDGMGKVVQALSVAVPEAGRALQGLARAVLFTSLESNLVVGERRVDVQSMNLLGRHARIQGRGQVNFSEQVAMNVELELEGKLLAKVVPQGALPLQIGGTLGRPQVLPRIDLAKLVGTGVAKDAVDRVRDLFGR